MNEESLIYMYHIAVLLVILTTAIITLGGIIKKGIFSNVQDKYIKILVGVLLIEVSGAFMVVYSTLPELQFSKAEEYKFEIRYTNILQTMVDKMGEEDKIKLNYFLNARNAVQFNKYNFCKIKIDEYLESKDIGTDALVQEWESRLFRKAKKCIHYFKNVTNEDIKEFERVQMLLEKYARYEKSSSKSGKGTMYLSTKNNNFFGIVTFRFPGDALYTVLEVSGTRKQNDDQNISTHLDISVEQAPSALAVDNIFIPRPGGKFSIKLFNTKTSKDTYKGEIPGGLGEIAVSLRS